MFDKKMFEKRKKIRVRLFFEGTIIGIFSGLLIAALRFILDWADIFRPLWFSSFDTGKIFLTAGVLILIACLLNFLIKYDKQVAGSGVPQVEGILQGKAKMFKPFRLLVLKFFAATLAIGSGMSLGRAGISVQFGACIGKIFSKFFCGKNFLAEETFLLTAGAGAGLAAIFSAPLSGVIFCVEELYKKFSSEILIASLSAAVSASAVVQMFFGIRPVFGTLVHPHSIIFLPSESQIKIFSLIIALGIFMGIVGAIFTKSLIFSLDFYDRLKIFGVKRFLIPLSLIILIGPNLHEILGCGNILVDELLTKNFTLQFLFILLFGKFLYTVICFGTGTPGGIFLPLLVIGALGGAIFAKVGIFFGIFTTDFVILFIILGMAACFAAVIKSPVTGSVLILELTGEFSHLLVVIIISCVAFLVSDLCGGKPAYSALLNRSLGRV